MSIENVKDLLEEYRRNLPGGTRLDDAIPRNPELLLSQARKEFNLTANRSEGILSADDLDDLWGDDGKTLTNIEGFIFQLSQSYQEASISNKRKIINLFNQFRNPETYTILSPEYQAFIYMFLSLHNSGEVAKRFRDIAVKIVKNNLEISNKLDVLVKGLLKDDDLYLNYLVETGDKNLLHDKYKVLEGVARQTILRAYSRKADVTSENLLSFARECAQVPGGGSDAIYLINKALFLESDTAKLKKIVKKHTWDIESYIRLIRYVETAKDPVIKEKSLIFINEVIVPALQLNTRIINAQLEHLNKEYSDKELFKSFAEKIYLTFSVDGLSIMAQDINLSKHHRLAILRALFNKADAEIIKEIMNKVTSSGLVLNDILDDSVLSENFKQKLSSEYGQIKAKEIALEVVPPFRASLMQEGETDVYVMDQLFRKTIGEMYEDIDNKHLEELLKDEFLIPVKDIDHRQAILRAILLKASSEEVDHICENLTDYFLKPADLLNDSDKGDPKAVAHQLKEKFPEALKKLEKAETPELRVQAEAVSAKVEEFVKKEEFIEEKREEILEQKEVFIEKVVEKQAKVLDIAELKTHAKESVDKSIKLNTLKEIFNKNPSSEEITEIFSHLEEYGVSFAEIMQIAPILDQTAKMNLVGIILNTDIINQAPIGAANAEDHLLYVGILTELENKEDDLINSKVNLDGKGIFREVNPFLKAVALSKWFVVLNISGRELIDLYKKNQNIDILNAIKLNTELGEKVVRDITISDVIEHQLFIELVKSPYPTSVYRKNPEKLELDLDGLSEEEISDILKSCPIEVRGYIWSEIIPFNSKYQNVTVEFRINLLRDYIKYIEHVPQEFQIDTLHKLSQHLNSYSGQEKIYPVLKEVILNVKNRAFLSIIKPELLSPFIDYCFDDAHKEWAEEILDKIVNYAYSDVGKDHPELINKLAGIFTASWTQRYAPALVSQVPQSEYAEDHVNFGVQLQRILQDPEAISKLTYSQFVSALENYERISKLLMSHEHKEMQRLAEEQKDKDPEMAKYFSERADFIKKYQAVWQIRGMLINLQDNLKNKDQDAQTKLEGYLKRYYTDKIQAVNTGFVGEQLYGWLFGKPLGDIQEGERPWYQQFVKDFLAPFGDNFVTEDLKLPIGMVLPNEGIYDEKGNIIGVLRAQGLIYVVGNDKELLSQQVKVGTPLYDKDKKYIGTLTGDSSINKEILINLNTAIMLLLDKNAFGKIDDVRKEQLFQRIIDLEGVPEFLKAASQNPEVINSFVNYLKNKNPILSLEAWESVVFWLDVNKIVEIFDAYREKPQDFLFAILCNASKVNDLGEVYLFKKFNECQLSTDTAESWLYSCQLYPRSENLIKVFLLSNKSYVDKLDPDKGSHRPQEKAKNIFNFRNKVAELALKNLSSQHVQGLDKRVRKEILRSMKFEEKNYNDLTQDFDTKEKLDHINAYINKFSPQEAVRFMLNIFKEDTGVQKGWFNDVINLFKNLFSGPAELEYRKNILQAVLSRPECVDYLAKLAKVDPAKAQLHEPQGSFDRTLFDETASKLLSAMGKMGTHLIEECFKKLGKYQRRNDKSEEFRKAAVKNLSGLLRKLHRENKSKNLPGLTDDQKSVSKEAGAEVGGPQLHWYSYILRIFTRKKYFVEETREEQKIRVGKETELRTEDLELDKLKNKGLFDERKLTSKMNPKEVELMEAFEKFILDYVSGKSDLQDQAVKVVGKQQNLKKQYEDKKEKLTLGEGSALTREIQSNIKLMENLKARKAFSQNMISVSKLPEGISMNPIVKLLHQHLKETKFDVEFDLLETGDLLVLADMLDENKLDDRAREALEKSLNKDLKNLRYRVAVSLEKRLELFEKKSHTDLFHEFFDGIRGPLDDFAKAQKGRQLLPPKEPNAYGEEEILKAEKPRELKNLFTDEPILAQNQDLKAYMREYISAHGAEKQATQQLEKVKPQSHIVSHQPRRF